jgi:hypothetical protein
MSRPATTRQKSPAGPAAQTGREDTLSFIQHVKRATRRNRLRKSALIAEDSIGERMHPRHQHS